MTQFSLTITIGGTCLLIISIIRQKTIWTPGVLFSLVWFLVLLSCIFDSQFRDGFYVPEESFAVLSSGLVGVYVGLFLVHLYMGRSRVSPGKISSSFSYLPSIVNRLFPYVFCLALASSIGAFVEAGADLSFSFQDLTDLRKQHVHAETYGIAKRISVYSSFLVSTFMIMLALCDFVVGKPNLRRVAILMSSLVPLAFAKGSRIELVTPFFYYIAAVWVLQGYRSRAGVKLRAERVRSRKLRNSIVLGTGVLAIVFVFYGQVRNVGQFDANQYGPSMRLALQITSYVSSSVYAVGPVTAYMDTNLQRGFGRIYFEAILKPMAVIGVVPVYNGKQELKDSYDRLGWIVNTPGTMIRYVAADWGVSLMPYFCFLIAVFSSAWLLYARPLTITSFLFTVLVCHELLYSFHKVGLFSMGNGYRILIVVLMSYWISVRRKNTSHSNKILTN